MSLWQEHSMQEQGKVDEYVKQWQWFGQWYFCYMSLNTNKCDETSQVPKQDTWEYHEFWLDSGM